MSFLEFPGVAWSFLKFPVILWSSQEFLEIPKSFQEFPGIHWTSLELDNLKCEFVIEDFCLFSSCIVPGKMFTESNKNIQTFIFDGGYDCYEQTKISQDVFSKSQYESLTALTIKRTNLTYEDLNKVLDFKEFKTLTYLDLSDNGFKSIDGNFGLSNDQLSRMNLDLSGNEVECSCMVSIMKKNEN